MIAFILSSSQSIHLFHIDRFDLTDFTVALTSATSNSRSFASSSFLRRGNRCIDRLEPSHSFIEFIGPQE